MAGKSHRLLYCHPPCTDIGEQTEVEAFSCPVMRNHPKRPMNNKEQPHRTIEGKRGAVLEGFLVTPSSIFRVTTRINQNSTNHGIRMSRSNRDEQSEKCKNLPDRYCMICCQIATWNVRYVFEECKIHLAIKEMQSVKISILIVNEMLWCESGVCYVDGQQVFHVGNHHAKYQNELSFIVAEYIEHV